MLSYPLTLTPDTNGALRFPDLPEAISVGDDEEDALRNGLEALEAALEIYFDERRPVPLPSKARKGQPVVTLPALVASKVLLWNEMLAQGVRKAELARRLDAHTPQIDRLFDLKHSSKIEFVEQALRALGKRLEVSLAKIKSRCQFPGTGRIPRLESGGDTVDCLRESAYGDPAFRLALARQR